MSAATCGQPPRHLSYLRLRHSPYRAPQETGLAVTATTRETARGDQLLRTLSWKWLRTSQLKFNLDDIWDPPSYPPISHQEVFELVLRSIFDGQLQIAAYLRRPSPEQLLARQYHARPARAEAKLEEGQYTSKPTRYLGQFSTHANLSTNNTMGSNSDSDIFFFQSTVNRKSNSAQI